MRFSDLRRFLWIPGLMALIGAMIFTDCSLTVLIKRGDHFGDILFQMIPPDFSYMAKIFRPLLTTVQMSITGTFLGSVLALLIAPFCARTMAGNRMSGRILRLIIQVLRSFPALILALMATFLFGIGTFAGTFALTVYTFAIMTRLTYEDIEIAGDAPFRALCAMGSAPWPAWWRSIFPQILHTYLTNALYMLETNVRHSAILGYVGAGGIGLLLNEKVSWREYDKVGSILLMLFAAVCLMEWISSLLAQMVRGEIRISAMGKNLSLAAVLLLTAFCTFTLAPPDFSHTNIRTLERMLYGFLHPDTSILFSLSDTGVLWLLLETVCISLVGTVFGAILALPLAFLNSGRLFPKPVALFFRWIVVAIRSVPFLIYGLIFIRVSGPGAFTGVLTLSFCSIGLLCKRFTQAIDSLDLKPAQALAVMGTPRLLCIRHGVIPQLIPAIRSAILYRFDVNIREASVLGLVGAGGIGAPLIFAMNQYAWSEASSLALGLIILVWIIDRVSARGRRQS